MTDTAGIPGERIRSFIERVEHIEEEIKAFARDSCRVRHAAPRFKRSYGRATKVTETLIEPPKFGLTRALLLPLAPTPTHNRVAITGTSVRLALMVQVTTNALSEQPA